MQGYVKNVLDEDKPEIRVAMLQYLGDLMEDTTEFSWLNAKASHAVLLCEMERGMVRWSDTMRIHRICHAHAQKHQVSTRQNWGKSQETRKPWFCKNFQNGACSFTKDHNLGGKIHRHICAFCLSQGRISNHAEKDCLLSL